MKRTNIASYPSLIWSSLIITCVLLICQSCCTAEHSSKCPENWVFNEDKCYFFSEKTMSWDEALHFCDELESDLLELTTRWEHDFIRRHASRDAWLNAASSAAFDYRWKGTDRKLVNHFTNWDQLEPSCARNCCVKIISSKNHFWFTEHCGRPNTAICVRDKRFEARFMRKLLPPTYRRISF